jgi:hypothetical protein
MNARNGVVALFTGKKAEPLPADSAPVIQEDSAADTPNNVTPITRRKRPANQTGLQWTAADLKAYIQATYQREIDDAIAGDTIKFLGGNKRLEGVVGQPYYANNRKAKAWADRTYGQQEVAD